MTKDDLNKLVAMYIIAIGPNGLPSTHLWLAVDPNMSSVETHQIILGALQRSELVTVKNHFVELTSKGSTLFEKINAIYCKEKTPA